MQQLQVGIDIGGTFTDLVLVYPATQAIYITKVLTTPEDSAIGAITGLKALLDKSGLNPEELERCVHATTLVSNAIIERKGARVGLITTDGFRDVLSMGSEQRYNIYDLFIRFPEPLVPRPLVMEVNERTMADGTILQMLDSTSLESSLLYLKSKSIESLAISFLHAYRNPANELEASIIASRIMPEIPCSLSHQVAAEIREYERTNTTVANAYVRPLAETYLQSLKSQLVELGYMRELLVMLSSGGVGTINTAARFPIRMLESGPAAGALASGYHARNLGLERVLAFDMGGTTAKLSTIIDGKPALTTGIEVDRVHQFERGSGLPIRVPVIDLIEIGTGGGSIASVDQTGLLQVGPLSSGSTPGPACYGRGGSDPTVTDANLLLGYLDVNSFLGGELMLDKKAAVHSIEQKLAAPLNLTLIEVAWGIHEIANESMANAARVFLAESGSDPRVFTLMAFGGAGPAHARRVAHKLGIKKIVYPAAAGVMSAFGLLVTPVSFDLSHSYMVQLDQIDWSYVNELYCEMERQALLILTEAGILSSEVSFMRSADFRYYGQEHEINANIPEGTLSNMSVDAVVHNFEKVFADKYYWINREAPVEAVNWRLHAFGPSPAHMPPPHRQPELNSSEASVKGHRQVFFESNKVVNDCVVYDRYRLPPGTSFDGPAIVEENETTIVIGANERVTIDIDLNLLVKVTT